MAYRVEQECHQCGAPVELDETDRLIQCPYCRVRSFLYTPDYYRFVLPRKSASENVIYAPYLRFRGAVFYCAGEEMGYRVVDINHCGAAFDGLPVSLGLRPQALKMRFLSPGEGSSCLKVTVKPSDILKRAANLSSGAGAGPTYHRAFIGEALSIIYFPVYVEGNRLFDAVTDMPILERLPDSWDTDAAGVNPPRWRVKFIPTLCPGCGWSLDGERDSVVLFCSNCDCAWEARQGKLVPVEVRTDPSIHPDAVYMPFWKTRAAAPGAGIRSFADYLRVTNQPVAVDESHGGAAMNFWSPAFKIRPKLFLNLARHVTLAQPDIERGEAGRKQRRHPVTLPRGEAAQALKMTLAGSAMNKRTLFPLLPKVRFEIADSLLVYIPFIETVHDLIQEKTNISINKNALAFGRSL